MKIDFNQNLKNLENQVLRDGGDNKVLTLKALCQNALLAPDQQASGEDKVKRFDLAMKLKDGGNINLESEEIALIKERASKVFPAPLIVGQVLKMLENK